MQHGHRHEDLVAALDNGKYAPEPPLSLGKDMTMIFNGGAPTTGPPSWEPIHVPASNVIAIMRFYGGPGRERDAAEAWAFEITYYYLRSVGEQPAVEYTDGVYTVSGMMTTTHPCDRAVTDFCPSGTAIRLDDALAPSRRTKLRTIYPSRCTWRFDGRDHDEED
jgi:hypothetical protein